ncbi:hypothetical protein [Caulobacter sp. S45]|uniref:hypothetical protein n=1 Tax=Caulobacter sp. S45 TaxID=1641861 RepID=UPI00157540D6|nr:hypothetical protein [Caulobacter sp. S45]
MLKCRKGVGLAFLVAWAGMTLSTSAAAQSIVPEPVQRPNPDDLKHRAVLCSWTIYLTAQAAGERCFPGQDDAFKADLNRGIKRIEDFIKRNGHVDQSYVSRWESQAVAESKAPGFCSSEAGKFYAAERARSATLQKDIDDLLSIPRTPVMNPCL